MNYGCGLAAMLSARRWAIQSETDMRRREAEGGLDQKSSGGWLGFVSQAEPDLTGHLPPPAAR